MEIIIFFILLFFGGAIIRAVLNAGSNAVRAVQGKEPLYSGPLEMKLEKEENEGEVFFRPMFRGEVPVEKDQPLAISLVLKDVATEEGEEKKWPVISLLDQVQETNTICFEYRQDIQARADTVWSEWINLAPVFPTMLQPPYSGQREIEVDIVFFTDDGESIFEGGYLSAEPDVLAVRRETFTWDFTDVGYLEESDNQKEGTELSIKIALAVAMADGSLDDSEGEVIQTWMKKNLEMMSDSKKEEMRPRLNTALREGYAEAESGELSLSPLCDRLLQIATTKNKFDTIELCMDVMAADGVAEESELRIIDSIASSIGLDQKEVERMKDERMVASNLGATESNSLAILGLDDSMTKREKQKQLRQEFRKWNDRLNSIEAGEERDNAQRMLDRVAAAKAKVDAE
jgi:tellurite resistance protein